MGKSITYHEKYICDRCKRTNEKVSVKLVNSIPEGWQYVTFVQENGNFEKLLCPKCWDNLGQLIWSFMNDTKII